MRFEGAWLEVTRFSVVGLGATLIHVVVALGLQHLLDLSPLLANFLAYGSAVSFSYMGNALWTFRGQGRGAPTALRFLAVSLLGLALNQGIVHITVNMLGWPFAGALAVVVMVVPATIFGLSKIWAFRPR